MRVADYESRKVQREKPMLEKLRFAEHNCHFRVQT
jgi:hypothetical protein